MVEVRAPASLEAQPRDSYLDAARACILDVGWRRTTLTEVARRAGVSRMTIYRTWSDMPQLLGDLMTREWTDLVTAVAPTQEYDAASAPSAEEIADLAVRAVGALRDNELFVRIVELDPELILPYLLARRGRSQEVICGLLAEGIRAAQAAGAVREGDPVLIARSLVLAAHGFVLSAHTMVDPEPAAGSTAVDGAALDGELRLLITRMLEVS